MTTALVPYAQTEIVSTGVEHVDVNAGLMGLSIHTARAYRRHITDYLNLVNRLSHDVTTLDFDALDLDMAIRSLSTSNLKVFLGQMKARGLGKQTVTQAKAAVVWLAQFLADLGRIPYYLPATLSRVKAPRAETGQRPGTWLSHDEISQLLSAPSKSRNSPLVARNKAILILLAICGLRRDEIVTATWQDLATDGGKNVLRVHGKGEKLRTVKLPDIAMRAIEAWKAFHPSPHGSAPLFSRVWKGGFIDKHGLNDRCIWIIVQDTAIRAGLGKLSPHDLRRSFARGAYEAGAGLELIRQVLGHANIATTEKYVNAKLELDEAATDIFARTFEDGA